ncbi:MAG: DinB family protein [Chitinophagaceae bacterium]
MQTQAQQEVWLRGPIPAITPLLQPAAHALLQAMEEIRKYTAPLNDKLIWERPAGLASVAFHLQHLVGVLDRLFTYAEENQLNEEQLAYLKNEGVFKDSITLSALMLALEEKISWSVGKLESFPPAILTDTRYVGRNKIPSTVIGLLFHAAEHTQRHTARSLQRLKYWPGNPGPENIFYV